MKSNEFHPRPGEIIVDAEWEPIPLEEKNEGELVPKQNPLLFTREKTPLLTHQPLEEPVADMEDPEMLEFDLDKDQDLSRAQSFIIECYRDANEYRASKGIENLSQQDQLLYDTIVEEYLNLADLISERREKISIGELNEDGPQQIGEKIRMLSEKVDTLYESQDEESEVISEVGDKKVGWFNKEYREDRGFADEVSEGSATQRVHEYTSDRVTDAPLPETPKEEGEKIGWWQDDFKRQRGVEVPEVQTIDDVLDLAQFEQVPNNDAIKYGEINVDGSEDKLEANSIPESIRQDWIEAKKQHEAAHKAYHDSAEEYYEGLKEQSFLAKGWSRAKASFGFKPHLPPEIQEQREEMFAATEKYNLAGRKLVENRNVLPRTLGGTLSGIRLRKEKELSEKASQSEEDRVKYEEFMERKAKFGNPDEDVASRYNKLLARSILLNTFQSQLEMQQKSTEELAFKGSKLMKKYAKPTRLIGAAVIGGLSGGVVGGGFALARVFLGGAASVATTGYVGKKMDSYVEKQKDIAAEDYDEEVTDLEKVLSSKEELSGNDLEDSYKRLSEIYTKVDAAMQARILAILGTSLATGVMVGGASGDIMDRLGIGATPDVSVSPETGESEVSVSESALPETNQVPEASPIFSEIQAQENATPESVDTPTSALNPSVESVSEVPVTTYAVEKGDYFWDIMEGQTEAKSLPVLEHIDPAHKQAFIDAFRDQIDSDVELRNSMGLGETADSLQAGKEVDLKVWNEASEAFAKEHGYYVEATPDAVAADVSPSESPTATESGADVEDSPTINGEAASSDSTIEAEAAHLTSLEKVVEFAKANPDRFHTFETDFQTNYIDKIQGPSEGGGLLELLFGNGKNTTDAFKIFDSYSVGEYKEMAKLDRGVLTTELDELGISIEKFDAWKKTIDSWNVPPTTRIGDAARAAFVDTLEKTPNPS